MNCCSNPPVHRLWTDDGQKIFRKLKNTYASLVWVCWCTNAMFFEKDCLVADSTVFEVFDFNLLKGNPKGALKESNTVVLTESTAKKYFGNEDLAGQMLKLDNDEMKVTGVTEDVLENIHVLKII